MTEPPAQPRYHPVGNNSPRLGKDFIARFNDVSENGRDGKTAHELYQAGKAPGVTLKSFLAQFLGDADDHIGAYDSERPELRRILLGAVAAAADGLTTLRIKAIPDTGPDLTFTLSGDGHLDIVVRALPGPHAREDEAEAST